MATKMYNLGEVAGERIACVVWVRDNERHMEQGYMILEDGTHVEIYIRNGGVSQRWAQGKEGVLEYCRRNDLEVVAVYE